ncbi:hypothetical protein L596_000613 [Steinernema carpocapsae]|uniref:Uncharacterized protein n=1 Tax=Steinernema carpocapsae TaxID=34508 RepID=A0A4U8UIR9_STECR|nr:hypothetical protein L596_000613 [Steinernema carpocapsae]
MESRHEHRSGATEAKSQRRRQPRQRASLSYWRAPAEDHIELDHHLFGANFGIIGSHVPPILVGCHYDYGHDGPQHQHRHTATVTSLTTTSGPSSTATIVPQSEEGFGKFRDDPRNPSLPRSRKTTKTRKLARRRLKAKLISTIDGNYYEVDSSEKAFIEEHSAEPDMRMDVDEDEEIQLVQEVHREPEVSVCNCRSSASYHPGSNRNPFGHHCAQDHRGADRVTAKNHQDRWRTHVVHAAIAPTAQQPNGLKSLSSFKKANECSWTGRPPSSTTSKGISEPSCSS